MVLKIDLVNPVIEKNFARILEEGGLLIATENWEARNILDNNSQAGDGTVFIAREVDGHYRMEVLAENEAELDKWRVVERSEHLF
jgi:hypothetical protein